MNNNFIVIEDKRAFDSDTKITSLFTKLVMNLVIVLNIDLGLTTFQGRPSSACGV